MGKTTFLKFSRSESERGKKGTSLAQIEPVSGREGEAIEETSTSLPALKKRKKSGSTEEA